MEARVNMGCSKDSPHPVVETTYTKWQREEGIPVHRGFWADLINAEVAPWPRKGCLGAYLNLADQESLDAYVAEIPPGSHSKPQRFMYEEIVYVLSGRGATTVWYEGMPKHTFEWQEGSLFAPPLNSWHQHFNGDGSWPVRYVALTTAPFYINLFHSKEFVYENPFIFYDRYRPEQDYFSPRGEQKVFTVQDSESSRYRGRVRKLWKTNFIPNARRFNRLTDHNQAMYAPGAARSINYALSENTLGGHIVQLESGFYKKAHRHGPGAHLIILQGKGYSLIWEEGKEKVRVDWKPGIVFSPPDLWYHNHFSTGSEPTIQLAMHWLSGGEYVGIHRGIEDNYGEQIEYEDEEPWIRKEFEEVCRKNGVPVRMPPVTYRNR